MRALVGYYGGKQRIAQHIVGLMPRHTVYVEPFCGGAAVLFAKPLPPSRNRDHYREVLNDVDRLVVNLYRVVQDIEAFATFRRLVTVPVSRSVHAEAVERCRAARTVTMPDPRLAADYYINLQWSYGHLANSGWGTGVVANNIPAIQTAQLANLAAYLDRLLLVNLECDDALRVIRRWDSPHTLFYCDPPYPGTDQGHYGGYTDADFAALVHVLDTSQGSFLLSCYDQPNIPSGWERFEFKTQCSFSGKGKTGVGRDRSQPSDIGERDRTEVVWRRDRSANAREDLQGVWATLAARGFRWGGDPDRYAVENYQLF